MNYEKDPFIILGISLDEARRLSSLNSDSRRGSLSILQRYFATIYHSDITGNPADDKRLGEINNALDTLEDDVSFSRALNEYIQTGGPPRHGGAYGALLQQAGYFKKEAEE